MICVDRLSKSYGGRTALAGVTLDVPRGQRLGVAGPRGSGRTTLLRAVASWIPATAGRVVVDGIDGRRDPFAARRKVFLAGRGSHYGDLSVGECRRLVAASRGGGADHTLVAAVDIASELPNSRRVADLTAAEQAVFSVAIAVVSGAPVLLCDDLFDGCDVVGREAIRRLLRLASRDATIIAAATTPEDLCGVCDRVVRLSEGRVWS